MGEGWGEGEVSLAHLQRLFANLKSPQLFEIRPYWRDPTKKIENPVAKATFVRTTGTWRVFWQRADLKWHSYEPAPQVGTVGNSWKLSAKQNTRVSLASAGASLEERR